MKTGKRLAHELVIGIAMFICLTGLLATPSESQAAAYSILHNFIGGTGDGYQPYYGAPVLYGSTLYGMTQGGGRYTTSGTLYRINTSGADYQVPHWFNAEDGIPRTGRCRKAASPSPGPPSTGVPLPAAPASGARFSK